MDFRSTETSTGSTTSALNQNKKTLKATSAICTPIQRTDYLLTPCLVLKESLRPVDEHDITTHDVIEAYNTLIYRFRISNDYLTLENAEVLALSLQRDLNQMPDSPLLPFAVRTLSNIFALTRLNSVFQVVDLASLLLIALRLYPAHPGHIRRLIAFALKTQSLPLTVFQQAESDLSYFLMKMIESCEVESVRDGLIFVERLLRLHKSNILPFAASSRLLVSILQTLDRTPALFSQATAVISALALAKLQTSDPCPPHPDFSLQLLDFLRSILAQKTQSQFINVINASLSNKISSPSQQSTLCLLASLIIIHDSELFFHAKSLKFYFNAHSISFLHTGSPSTALCYRCLVWAYGRIPVSSDKELPAFRTVLQEVREGIGTALVLTVRCKDESNPERAICVIQRMFSTGDASTVFEGFKILEQLVGTGQEEACASQNLVLPMAFFDSSYADLSKSDVTYSVPHLNSHELEAHFEALLSLWKMGVVKVAPNVSKQGISAETLTHIFQRLLLSRSQFTQHYGHLTTERHVYERLGALLSDLLPTSLALVYKFWGVVIRVFGASYLDCVGQILLQAVLDLPPARVVDEAGVKLFKSLVQEIDFRASVTMVQETQLDVSVQRCIWLVLVDVCCSQPDVEQDTRLLLQLLRMPLGHWHLSEAGIQTWQILLTCTLRMIPWYDIAERLTDELGHQAVSHLCSNLKIANALLSPEIETKLVVSRLPEGFLSVLSSVLTYLYPPSDHQSTKDVLSIFCSLRTLVERVASDTVPPLLKTLSACIETWLGDVGGHIPVQEYNSILMDLYKTILIRLEEQDSSHELMLIISPILASVFETIPEPHLGPDAFVRYWKKCWQGKERDYCSSFGKTLVDCLTTLWGPGPWEIVPDSEDDIQSWDHHSCMLDCTRAIHPDMSDILDDLVLRSAKKRRVSHDGSPQSVSVVYHTQETTHRYQFSAPDITSPMSTLLSLKKPRRPGVFPPARISSRNTQLTHRRGFSGISSITSPRDTVDVIKLPPPEPDMDYDNWEVCISTPEACRIREQLSNESPHDTPLGEVLGSPFRVPEKENAFITPPRKAGSSTKIVALRQAYKELVDPENSSLMGSQDLEEARDILQNLEAVIQKQGKRKARS